MVDAAGEVIEYTITVDNTGNVDLTGVVLTDAFAGGATLVSGDINNNSMLETSETWVYTADYVVTQADLNAGTAWSTWRRSTRLRPPRSRTTPPRRWRRAPALTIVKALTNAADAVVDTAGESIEYTITVANTGNADLTGVVLDDAFAGGATLVSGDTDANSMLEISETWLYTADHTVTQADLERAATATWSTWRRRTAPDRADAATTPRPGGAEPGADDREGRTDPSRPVDAAGEVMSYTMTVDNTGNVDLTSVVVTDPLAPAAPVLVSGDNSGDTERCLRDRGDLALHGGPHGDAGRPRTRGDATSDQRGDGARHRRAGAATTPRSRWRRAGAVDREGAARRRRHGRHGRRGGELDD